MTRGQTQHVVGSGKEVTAQWIGFFCRRFLFVPDPPDLVDTFTALVRDHGVKGFRTHDARYVAFAKAAGIPRLMTFDPIDFQGLPIALVDPSTV